MAVTKTGYLQSQWVDLDGDTYAHFEPNFDSNSETEVMAPPTCNFTITDWKSSYGKVQVMVYGSGTIKTLNSVSNGENITVTGLANDKECWQHMAIANIHVACRDNLTGGGYAINHVTLGSLRVTWTEGRKTVTPSIRSPVGQYIKIPTCTFRWTNDAKAATDAQLSWVQIRATGADSFVNLASVSGIATELTTKIPADILAASGFDWRVATLSESGNWAYSSSASCTYKIPDLSVADLYPTGTVYQGFPVTFGWGLKSSEDSVYQTGATVQYRIGSAGDVKTAATVAGAGRTATVAANVLPAGSLQWRVVISTNAEMTVESAWQSLNNAAPPLTLSDFYPTQKTYHGFDQVFRWALSSSVQGVYQTKAEIQYREDGGVSYEIAGTVIGGANTITIAGDILPVGKFDWRVMVTVNTGHTATSAWQSCTNVEVPISIEGLFPDANGRAPSRVQNRFGWTFIADDDDAPGAVTQVGAIFYWRPAGQGSYKSIPVQGALQYVDTPASTLPYKGSIEWYVEVTANTGTKATSDTVTVSTVDTLSAPVAVSPAGVFLDDSVQGITFTWRHVNATGTPQTGYELSYSEDSGASYKVLQTADGEDVSWTSLPKAFAVTAIYWRIRTKNSDGDLGNYSIPAIFSVRRNPDAPTIVSFDQKPLPSIAWQSEAQTGYEVEVDGVSYGMVYGTGKTWRSPALLADGQHTIRVRIVNQYRDVSAWATVTINVQNVPRGGVQLTLDEQWAQVQASWGLPEGFLTACLLRDGALIAISKEAAGQYHDRASVGPHAYTLRAFDVDGYYTDSAPMMAAPRVPYAAIGLLDGDDWTLLKYAKTVDRYNCNHTQQGSFVQFYGEPRPVWRPTGSQQVVHTLSYAQKRGESLQPLLDMRGQTVVYKDYEGHLAVGTYTAVQAGCGRVASVAMQITETYQKELDYAGV